MPYPHNQSKAEINDKLKEKLLETIPEIQQNPVFPFNQTFVEFVKETDFGVNPSSEEMCFDFKPDQEAQCSCGFITITKSPSFYCTNCNNHISFMVDGSYKIKNAY